jgi:hypothetical protein
VAQPFLFQVPSRRLDLSLASEPAPLTLYRPVKMLGQGNPGCDILHDEQGTYEAVKTPGRNE